MLISRQNQKLIQQHNPPDRRLYLFFFRSKMPEPVIKISRHNKKTANFPPEPKTDTIQQHNLPDRRLYLFFPVVIARTAHPTDRRASVLEIERDFCISFCAHAKRGQVPPAHAKRVCFSVRQSVCKG